ncbi:MAG: PLP-dependent aminotransferase family protein [Acidobacteria bacterium]|nr:PLP-dependent aminotransferase family protein [Acidobacteriota bacterium]
MSYALQVSQPTDFLAAWARELKHSALQDMLVDGSRPGILSLALGLPAAELFPVKLYSEAVKHVLSTDPKALQYGPPFEPLKKHIVKLMARRGVECREEQIFLTAGAQQGTNLLARLLVEQGSQVIVEEKTFTGFQQVLEPYQPEILTVPTDLATGMDVDAVERLLVEGAKPALIYAIADGHNPLAVCMSREKRIKLARLARKYRVPVIEDDPYGFISYNGYEEPPLRAFDDEWVFYVGTFSKIMAPALRTGWLIVPESLVTFLATVKEATDINTAPLNQRAISAYLDGGHFDQHLSELTCEYRRRRDVMIAALTEEMPEGTRWQKPGSGLFVWVELPSDVDTGVLLRQAIDEEQLVFIPGHAFAVNGHECPKNSMRLNFSNNPGDRLADGVARLARVLKRQRAAALVEKVV